MVSAFSNCPSRSKAHAKSCFNSSTSRWSGGSASAHLQPVAPQAGRQVHSLPPTRAVGQDTQVVAALPSPGSGIAVNASSPRWRNSAAVLSSPASLCSVASSISAPTTSGLFRPKPASASARQAVVCRIASGYFPAGGSRDPSLHEPRTAVWDHEPRRVQRRSRRDRARLRRAKHGLRLLALQTICGLVDEVVKSNIRLDQRAHCLFGLLLGDLGTLAFGNCDISFSRCPPLGLGGDTPFQVTPAPSRIAPISPAARVAGTGLRRHQRSRCPDQETGRASVGRPPRTRSRSSARAVAD